MTPLEVGATFTTGRDLAAAIRQDGVDGIIAMDETGYPSRYSGRSGHWEGTVSPEWGEGESGAWRVLYVPMQGSTGWYGTAAEQASTPPVAGVYSNTYLRDLDLRGKDLRNATFFCCMSDGADLSGLDLSGANFDGTEHFPGQLSEANCSGANFTGADLSWSWARNSDFRDANFTNANLANSDFTGSDFTGACLDGADFTDARGADIKFTAESLLGAKGLVDLIDGVDDGTYAEIEVLAGGRLYEVWELAQTPDGADLTLRELIDRVTGATE